MRNVFPTLGIRAAGILVALGCLPLAVPLCADEMRRFAPESGQRVKAGESQVRSRNVHEARTWRVMPIGDSITEASGSRNSYRRPLWFFLEDAGIAIDFVGSQSGNRDGQVPNPDFDTDHEGHWGWRVDRFLQNDLMETWSQTYMPDVILIHLGTNDIFQGQSVSSTINEIGRIIDIVRDANPEVIVLLAQVIPTSDPSRPGLVPFNEAIPGLASSRDRSDSPVRVVDQYSGFDAAVDTYDGVHPNLSGENKMARKWFDAMQPLLSQNEAPRFTSSAITAATQDVPYAYDIAAEDPDSDAPGITAPEQPDWLILVDNGDGTARISGTPGNAHVGDNFVRLMATDPEGAASEQEFTINVANVNDAPRFTSNPLSAATEATEYHYLATVQDPDGDPVRITAATRPAWLALVDNNDGTAMLSGIPDGADVGIHTVELEAAETGTPDEQAATQTFALEVAAAPEGPTISLNGDAALTLTEGDVYEEPGATASDPQDGDLSDQIMIDNPLDSDVPGIYTIIYSVADTAGNEARAERTVTVRAAPTTSVQPTSGGGAASVPGLLLLLVVAASRIATVRGVHGGTFRRAEQHL